MNWYYLLMTMFQHITQAAAYAGAGILIGAITFVLFEPHITFSQTLQDTSEFTISQEITGENSFLVEPTDVTMSGSIGGLTGGQATGTTQFVVRSNNAGGYYVEINFSQPTGPSMRSEVTGDATILDYVAGATEPTKGYVANAAPQFAYTVTSDILGHTDQSFFHDAGPNCNTGGDQASTCWKAPSFAPFRIVDNGGPAPTGATSTILFDVTVPAGADPAPVAEIYTATATLSLFTI
jgi:hypothetical protein